MRRYSAARGRSIDRAASTALEGFSVRIRLLAALAATLSLTLAFALAGAADARPVGTTGSASRATAAAVGPGGSKAAQQALARAEALFGSGPSSAHRSPDGATTPRVGTTPGSTPVPGDPAAGRRDATMVLRDLAARQDQLTRADRRTAHNLLARPTTGGDPTGGYEHPYTTGVPVRKVCNTEFCVHWVDPLDAPGDQDAVPRAAGDTGYAPAWARTTIATIQHVWDAEVGAMGYTAPLGDGALTTKDGGSQLDIYLSEIGNEGLYGYCTTDDPNAGSKVRVAAYCVLDNDYKGFSGGALASLQVTAAHEFFHAVQFDYDWLEDIWLMEGTAAWMEDEVYDKVNDNLQYLAQSPLQRPGKPLDFSSASYLPYGSWVFWKYLSESAAPGRASDPTIVRQVWQHAKPVNTYSALALKQVLTARRTSLTNAFRTFATWNRMPARRYSEGSSYPTAPLAKHFSLSRGAPATGSRSLRISHLANGFVRFSPGRTLTGSWRLRVTLDLPNLGRGAAAALIVRHRNGSVGVRPVALRATGNATVVASFTRADVSSVELSLTNASTRFACWQGRVFSCQGKPRDDNLVFRYAARAIR